MKYRNPILIALRIFPFTKTFQSKRRKYKPVTPLSNGSVGFSILEMKNVFLISLPIVAIGFLFSSCVPQTQPAVTSTITIAPTQTLTSIAAITPTATFLPTYTPIPLELIITPFSTPTLTPVPKDIFDNFQELSGNCRTVSSVDSLMAVRYFNEESHIISLADVSISFDKEKYFSGDDIKVSLSANDNYNGIVVKVIIEDPVSKQHSLYLYDDGSHKDEKANDGIYANTFGDTVNTGIYKFYFQLSGHNKTTGETLAKECFLAKTINSTSSPTAALTSKNEDKACRRIETSAPIVVRPEGVGGNDSSELSWWAYKPKAVSMGERILAIWQVGFDGQRPKPNVYMRILNSNLRLAGEVKLLFDRNVIGSTTLIRQEDKAIFSYCGRYNTEDRSTSAFLDSYGNLISEIVRSPTNIACVSGPLSVWTGSHMLFYSAFNTFDHFGVFLNVADPDGNSISWREVPTYSLPTVTQGGMLMRAISQDNSLTIHHFDLAGNDLGEWATLKAIPYEVDGKLAVGSYKNAFVVPTNNGWMVIASLTTPGIYIAHLSPDGSLISEPIITEKNLYFESGFIDGISHNGSIALLGCSYPFGYSTKTGCIALFISEDNTITQYWLPKGNDQPMDISFFEHQNRLFMIYTSKHTDEERPTNQVLIRELQCIP
jgi:hypothetical protein